MEDFSGALMAKLLYIEASPLKERSHTIEAAGVFLDAYREANPEDTIEAVDLWALAGENWTWTREEDYRALLSGKRALLIYSSAGAYSLTRPPDPADFQKSYLRHWLSFIGVHNIEEINVAPTLADPALVSEVKSEARLRALAPARSF